MASLFKKNFDSKMHSTQKTMLQHAQRLADVNNITLDYSEDLISRLDSILNNVRKELGETGLKNANQIENNEAAIGISEALGCYIVECIERAHGKGKWFNQNPVTGEHEVGYLFNNSVIYPIDWIMKGLVNPRYSVEDAYAKWILQRR